MMFVILHVATAAIVTTAVLHCLQSPEEHLRRKQVMMGPLVLPCDFQITIDAILSSETRFQSCGAN